jgi:ATP-dependent DNA helicase DinG
MLPPEGAEELLESAEEMLGIVGKPPDTTEKDKNREKHAAELVQWREGMLETMDSFRWCAAVGRFPEWAYWWDGRSILSAPSECSGFIRDWFFPKPLHALVAVSATMAIGNDFSFWEGETGLRGTERMVLDSPFPLEEQMKVWIVDMGLRVTDEAYDRNVAAVVEKLCEENGGSTLVLLSSMRLMKSVAEKLGKIPRPWPVLVQGDLPRNELLRRFREEISSVLVGSVSFREGIDVPGDGLTQVIIDRIPFPHPGDPLLVTRRAMEGPSIFTEMILPLAKLLLKQAAGRLIRSRTDRGKVVILDGRVLGRRDWRITEALPKVVYRKVKVEVQNRETSSALTVKGKQQTV